MLNINNISNKNNNVKASSRFAHVSKNFALLWGFILELCCDDGKLIIELHMCVQMHARTHFIGLFQSKFNQRKNLATLILGAKCQGKIIN
jgi:hypothetical protein